MFWGVTLAAVAGVGLRLWRLDHGLPDLLEEAIPLRRALEMWGWAGTADDLNPRTFLYPSLTIYLHYLVQKLGFFLGEIAGRYDSTADYLLDFLTDPTYAVRLSRGLGIAADAVSVVYAGILGRRFGPQVAVIAAAMVALAPTMIATSSAIFTDNVMTALSLAALERLSAYLEGRDRRTFFVGAVLIGLAVGAKYTAACLLVPMAWASWRRTRQTALNDLALGGVVAALAFVLTTPYAALDFATFLADLTSIGERLGAGYLGATKSPGVGFYWGVVLTNLGWLGAIGATLSLRLLARSELGALLWLALASFALPAVAAKAEFDRYLVPILPLGAILGSAGAMWALNKLAPTQSRIGVGVLSILLLVPPLFGALRVASVGRSTQTLAREWFEARIGARDLVLQEAYAAQVLTLTRRNDVIKGALFPTAGMQSRRRFLSRRWYHMVGLPLVVSGPPGVQVGDAIVPMVKHAVDLNEPVYDLRLFRGVDYVVTSSAVRARYEADTVRFDAQIKFYRFLDRDAEKVASFEAESGNVGPTIEVYRLGERARSVLMAEGRLHPAWWHAGLLGAESKIVGRPAFPDTMEGPSSSDLRWAEGATIVYVRWYAPFLGQLIANHHALGHCEDVLRLARMHLGMVPEDADALLAGLRCAGSAGRWGEARELAERVIPHLGREGWIAPEIMFEYARILSRSGDRDRARKFLEHLDATAQGEIAMLARKELILMRERGGLDRTTGEQEP